MPDASPCTYNFRTIENSPALQRPASVRPVVAQVSKPAVSPISKSAGANHSPAIHFAPAKQNLGLTQIPNSWPHIFPLFLCAFFLSALTACRAPHVWPPISFSDAGWKIYNGQAVWHPRPKAPELSGDVLLAIRTNGESFIQFSKTLPFATARLDSDHWQIEFPSEKRKFSGKNPPLNYFVFPQLPCLVTSSNPPAPWIKTGDLRNWTLKNSRSGETLQGYFDP